LAGFFEEGLGFREVEKGSVKENRGWLGFVEGCKGILLGTDGKLRSELNYPGKYIRTIHAPAVSLSPYKMYGQKLGKPSWWSYFQFRQ